MPNWCMNTLTVSGEAKELKNFIFASLGLPAQYPPVHLEDGICLFEMQKETEPFFCFNALIPTPPQVLDIGFDGHAKYPAVNMMKAILTGEEVVLDGYHWNIQNWGTKWDVYYDKITPEEMGWHEGCEGIEFEFDTAWSPPRAWFETVVSLFPKLRFKLHYEEPGCYFAGDLIWEDEILQDTEYTQQQCAEAFAWMEEDEDDELLITSENGGQENDYQQARN